MAIPIQIREITPNDIASIVSLSDELGYKINEMEVTTLISAIIQDDKQWAFVAVKNNTIVGFVHAFYALRLTTPAFIEIAGLVVSSKERSQGIGQQLVEFIEQNIAKNLKIRIRCNSTRKDAHRFYSNLGYARQKEQIVFVK
ncbi:MAG: GNAT family N-acetyltransferase [Flavobacteriales bacterium]